MKKRRKKFWSFSAGPYGYRVRAYAYPSSKGVVRLYLESRDPITGKLRCESLHLEDRSENRDEAIRLATERSLGLQTTGEAFHTQRATVLRVLSLYLEHQTPTKSSESEREADLRRAKMWTRVLGRDMDLSQLPLSKWNTFIQNRRSGLIDAHGRQVAPEKRRPVRDGTVWADLVFLSTAMNWASRWRTEDGKYLMRENPARGYPMPREKNVRRPVATEDRLEQILAVVDQVTMRVGRGKKAKRVPSYLREILEIVNGTGRRINAVLALRYRDLRPDQGPHGSICWPADTDKTGREWLVPMSPDVRAAIDRVVAERPGIGGAFLFPALHDPEKHISKERASEWLRDAETLAGVPKQEGGLWHPYRRKWATERKDLPVADVAAAGGWSDRATVQNIYQQVDQETLLRVVTSPTKLREAR